MIDHIPELINANITSLKIEGRMKGINYLASVVKTYRNAIDSFFSDPENYKVLPEWHSELYQVYHRAYCTGFYFDHPDESHADTLNQDNTHLGKIHSFIGKILICYDNNRCLVEIRNKLNKADQVEILSPKGPAKRSAVLKLTNPEQLPIENAQPNTCAILHLNQPFEPNDIIRKI